LALALFSGQGYRSVWRELAHNSATDGGVTPSSSGLTQARRRVGLARLPANAARQGNLVPGTNLPRPGGPHDTADSAHEPADLTEVVRLYGIRHWIEQSYKQVKDELGWADFQVRSATGIRRHQTLVHCAFSFCWNTWFDPPSTNDSVLLPPEPSDDDSGERGLTRRPTG
jgi:hypothetical protein